MKLGVMEDTSNRTRLSKLLRFYTSSSPDKMIPLGDYIERMKEKQDTIYYMCGNGKAEVSVVEDNEHTAGAKLAIRRAPAEEGL